jgi:3-O-methylgallate 3,4-dioxygenase
MAKVVGVFNTVHSPFCFMAPEHWNEVRANRSLREDVPIDDLEANQQKYQRIQDAFGVLKEKLYGTQPDIIVMYGDDQLESFDFTNFPPFAVYVGDEYEGPLPSRDASQTGTMRARNGETAPPERAHMTSKSDIAVGLLTGLMERNFDPAFCMDMPKPEKGMGHAFMRPAAAITDLKTPVLPVLVNCYFAPQPTAQRCYEFGLAVREAIESLDSDSRVAIVGSGGLWHTPGAKDAYLDEDFDRTILSHLEAGDAQGMAEAFDTYKIPEGDTSQYVGERTRLSTGMPGFGGPQGGTREICNWVAAAAATGGSKSTIIDYIPVYASPIGAGFSYCTNP